MAWRWAALLALPFFVVAVAGRFLVPRWGDAIARALKDAVAFVPPVHAPPPPKPADSSDVVPITVPDLDAGAAPIVDGGAKRPVARRGGDAGTGRLAVVVSAAAVQRAIDDGGKSIRGRTVRGPDGKPVGVRLTGVSKAKIGLEDGDVIVAVDGKPTPDDDVATDVALAAIARGSSTLRATVMRGAQPIDVTLELPLAPVDPGKKVR